MLNKLLGLKIGMTQVFDKDRNVIPVTIINTSNWVVTQIKTQENDGYCALQLGLVKKKYKKTSFDEKWLKSKNKYFVYCKEVLLDEKNDGFVVGQTISVDTTSLKEGDSVVVTGTSRGLGFQGVVKRWGFAGGPATHGSRFKRRPGSIGNICAEGKVYKGKRLPGRCGGKTVTIKGMEIVSFDKENGSLFVKGSVPGKKESLLFISKQG